MKKLFYPISSFFIFIVLSISSLLIVANNSLAGTVQVAPKAPIKKEASSSTAQGFVVQKAPLSSASDQKQKKKVKKRSKKGVEVKHSSEDQKQTDSIKAAQNKLKGIK